MTDDIRYSLDGMILDEDLCGQVARKVIRMVFAHAPLAEIIAVYKPFEKTWDAATQQQIDDCDFIEPSKKAMRVALKRGGLYL